MKPRVTLSGTVTCGTCLSPLTPIEGRALDRPVTWLWWRCDACGDATDAVPVPPGATFTLDTPTDTC